MKKNFLLFGIFDGISKWNVSKALQNFEKSYQKFVKKKDENPCSTCPYLGRFRVHDLPTLIYQHSTYLGMYFFHLTTSVCTYSFSVLSYSNNAWFPQKIVDMWLRKVSTKSSTWPRNTLKIQPIFNKTKWVQEFLSNCF